MNNFTYYTPTKVVFGRGSEGQTGALVRERGCKKVLLHYGGGSAVRSGLLDRVKDSLREAGLEWTELGGALPTRGSPWCGRAWTCAGGRGWTSFWP